jgi:hypothetical protein
MKKFLPALSIFFLLSLAFLIQPSLAFAGASLSFSPASKSVMVGDSFEVDVVLDTGSVETDGVDILISYDEMKLEAKNATLGNLYDNKINEDVSQPGKIVLQAVSDVGSGFVGKGNLAKLSFKAIAGGPAQVSFEMMGESTTDCNVSANGEDILASVSNGTYTIVPEGIGAGVATASGTPTPTVTGTLTPTPTVPETGFLGPTAIGLGFGGILIFLAFSLLVFL